MLIVSTFCWAALTVGLIVNNRAVTERKLSMFHPKCLVREKSACDSGVHELVWAYVCWACWFPTAQCTRVNNFFFFFFCIISLFLLSVKTWIFKTTSNKHSWNIKMFENKKSFYPLPYSYVFSSLSLVATHQHTHVLTHMRIGTPRIYPRVRTTNLPTRSALLWHQHIAALNREDAERFNNLAWIEFLGIIRSRLGVWMSCFTRCQTDASHFRRACVL